MYTVVGRHTRNGIYPMQSVVCVDSTKHEACIEHARDVETYDTVRDREA
jgi:hypothetical protein